MIDDSDLDRALIKELADALNDIVEDFQQYLVQCCDEPVRESIVAAQAAVIVAKELMDD